MKINNKHIHDVVEYAYIKNIHNINFAKEYFK